MHEVLVNRLGGLSLPRKSVVRLTDRPDMTLDVYRGRKTTIQQQQPTVLQYTKHYKCKYSGAEKGLWRWGGGSLWWEFSTTGIFVFPMTIFFFWGGGGTTLCQFLVMANPTEGGMS